MSKTTMHTVLFLCTVVILRAYGADTLGGLGQAGNAAKSLGSLAGGGNCVQEDASCDFSQITSKLSGGGVGGLPFGRRRRDPTAAIFNMFKDSIGKKVDFCDQKKEDNKLNQWNKGLDGLKDLNVEKELSKQKDQLAENCKKNLDTQKQQCESFKKIACGALNGKLTGSPMCAMQQLIKAEATVQVENNACDSAEKLVKNPGDASNILQHSASGSAPALGAMALTG